MSVVHNSLCRSRVCPSQDMEVYFTPLPSYDMLSSALSETAMDIMPSVMPSVEVAPVVLPTAHVQAPMVETVSPALPDYEEGMPEPANAAICTDAVVQKPARPTFLLDALLKVSTPATSSAEDTVVYDNEDGDAKEDEEVWYEASDEEATLLARRTTSWPSSVQSLVLLTHRPTPLRRNGRSSSRSCSGPSPPPTPLSMKRTSSGR